MNEKLKALYENLKGTYQLPDYDTFAEDLRDPSKSKPFYETLIRDGYEMPPDYDSFVNDLGIKKKDLYETLGFGRDLVQEVFGEDYKEPEVSKKPTEIEEKKTSSITFENPIDTISKAFRKPQEATADLSTPDLTIYKPGLKGIPQNGIEQVFFDALSGPIKEKKEQPTFENYLTALPKGFNERMAQFIRGAGAWLNLPEKAMEKGVENISGKETETTKATQSFLKQAFASLPIIGMFNSENIEGLASAIENAGHPKEVPDDIVGKTLSSVGSILFDIMTVRSMPTSKLEILSKYGMNRVPNFPSYLAAMEGTTAAMESKGFIESAKETGKGFGAGLTYEGIGVAAGRVGQLVRELGGTQALSSSSRALANSVLFGADSKVKGGSFAEGAAMGLVFGGYDLGMEGINRSIAHRAYVSYLTTTDNAIKTISGMRVDPVEMRKMSDELWLRYEKETDPQIKKDILEDKTAVDNILNVNAITQSIIQDPSSFIENIRKDALLSEKEKTLWIDKINKTVEDADPRIQEATPIREDIQKLEGQLNYWQNDYTGDAATKQAKITGITAELKTAKEGLSNILNKPLSEYQKEEKLPEEKPPEEVKPQTPEEIATQSGVKYMGEQKGEEGGSDLDLYNVEVKPDMFDTFSVNKGASLEEVTAKRDETLSKWGKKPPEPPVKGTKVKKPRTALFKPGSRSYKALDETPGDFTDSVMQFFIGGKKISKEDFVAHSGWSEADIKKSGIGFLLSKGGQKLDTFNEAVENSFGIEGKGSMDMINEIIDIAKNNPSRGKMLDAFEKRRNLKDQYEPTEEEVNMQASDEKFAEIISRNGGLNAKSMADALKEGLVSKEEYADFLKEMENESTEREQQEREWADEEARIATEESGFERGGENIPPGEKPGEGKEGSDVKRAREIEKIAEDNGYILEVDADLDPDFSSINVYDSGKRSVTYDELPKGIKDLVDEYTQLIHENKVSTDEGQIQQPPIRKGKEAGAQLPGGIEPGEKGVAGKGKEKPPEYTAEQQKQVDAINKEYDAKIADAQKELEGMTEEARNKVIAKAEAEVNRRNTIFGDAEAKETDLIKPGEQGFEVSRKPIDEATKKFDERKVELTKQIDALNKERESKIGEVAKQQTLGFEEKPSAKVELRSPEEKHTNEEDNTTAQKELERGFKVYKSFFKEKGTDQWRKAYVLSAPFLTEANALKSAKYQLLADSEGIPIGKENETLDKYDFKVEEVKSEKPKEVEGKKPRTIWEAKFFDNLLSSYDVATSDWERNKVTDDAAFGLSGKSNVRTRQSLMEYLTGEKPPQSQSGVHNLKAELDKWVKEQKGTKAPSKVETPVKELPTTKDQVKFERGGREWTADVLHVYPDGRVDVDVFGRKTINPEEYTIVKPSKGEGKAGGPEGFPSTPRAKAAKKLKIEPKVENPEDLAWDQPLPMSLNEDPSYKSSDLNNAMSLRNMGRNLVKNLGKTEGEQVRTGLIKRFMRRAAGIFNPQSGVIRVKNISDVRVLSHELGHWIDHSVFDIRGVIGYRAKVEGDRYADVTNAAKITGVKFKNKTYRTEDAINEALKVGKIDQKRAGLLIGKLTPQLKAREARLGKLREKYGDTLVDGVIQRQYFKQELDGYLAYVGYPSKKRTEAIAEFIKDYVVNPDQAKTVTPKFHAWFEKLLDNTPEVKDALTQARADWNKYDAQDPRMKVLTLFAGAEEKPSFLDGIIKIDKNKILYSWVNHLQYMKNLSRDWQKIMGGKAVTYKDPFYSAKTMMGIDGRAQQFLLYHPYERKGGDIRIRKDIEGLMSVLKPIIGTSKDMDFRGYLLAKDSMESHQNGHPERAAMSLDLAQSSIKLWEEQYGVRDLWDFQGKIQKYNESLLDFYVDSGKMSKEDVEVIKSQHQYYVPLKRLFDEYEVGGGNGLSKQMLANSEKAVWSRHGSQKAIKDIYQSMIENTYNILAAGERNVLLNNVKDAMFDIQKYNKSKKIDTAIIEEIPPNTVKAYFDVATGEMRFTVTKERPKTGRILNVWENGKVHYYDVAPEYYDPLFQQEPKVTELIRKLSIPSRWLQAGAVVYDPTFPIRNIIRDQQSAWFYSKYSYLPTDFVKGIASFIGKDEYYQKWLASGGDQSFLISADRMMEKDYAKKKVGRTLQRKWEAYRKNPLLPLQDLSRASEIGTRLGAFRNAYKKTGDVWKAAIESRDVSADYGIHGAKVRQALSMYPFLNARAQHARMVTESLRNPAQFFLKGMALTAPAVMNWLLNNQDEESQKLYQSLPTWRRVGLYNIRIPGTDHFLPLPKGFYGVLFGSSAEALLDATLKDDPRVIKELPSQLFSEFSPVGNLTELVPFPIRPQIEMWANKKGYTGKPIISESLRLLKPSEQYYNSTPEIYKKMGEALNWSPAKIDHYIRSYTGGAGMGAVNILDETLQMMGWVDKKPEDTFTALSRMPVFKALLTEKPIGLYSGYVSDFYSTLDKVEKLNTTFNKLVKTEDYDRLDKLMADPDNQRMYSFFEGNSTAIGQFRDALTWIRDAGYAVMKDDNLTQKEKQDEISRMNNIVQESVLQFKNAYENNEFFDYGKNMDTIIEKMKSEKKDTRGDIKQQQNIYNPYWQSLKKDNATVFNLIKEYGGFKDIDQRIKLSREGLEPIDLSIEKSRIYNEKLVQNYTKRVKSILGEKPDKYISEQDKGPLNPTFEGTRLEESFKRAWEEARKVTTNEFITKKLYKEE